MVKLAVGEVPVPEGHREEAAPQETKSDATPEHHDHGIEEGGPGGRQGGIQSLDERQRLHGDARAGEQSFEMKNQIHRECVVRGQ